MLQLKEPENEQIGDVYGPLLKKSFERLKGLSIEDFQPATQTIVVKKAPPEVLTDGGIHIPVAAQKEQNIGVVVRINADKDCPWKVGQLVVFRTGGHPLELDKGDQYLVLQYRGCIDDEILGSFRRDDGGET